MTLVLLRGLRLTLVCLAFVATVTEAADWGGIAPGTSTKDTVQKIFGAPSRTEQKKLEGYDVSDWVYEGPRAPGGVVRMTIEFGLLAGQNFKPDIVRVMSGGREVCRMVDLNHDDKPDSFIYFDGGGAIREGR